MDRATWSGVWPDDKAAILRGLGENPIPMGHIVYVDFHFERPLRRPPEPSAVGWAAQAEADLRTCLADQMPAAYRARLTRHGSVVRFTYRKPSPLGELDTWLPLCVKDQAWVGAIVLVEFGEVVPWWRYPVPWWGVALGAAASGFAGWALARRSTFRG